MPKYNFLKHLKKLSQNLNFKNNYFVILHKFITPINKKLAEISPKKASRITPEHCLDTLFKKILSCKLWILDDWGVISMDRDVAEEVFDLLDRRKQTSALILTSNRAVEEWADIFPDPILASATIDRLFDRAEILTYQGDSYRLKGRIRSEAVDSSLIDE